MNKRYALLDKLLICNNKTINFYIIYKIHILRVKIYL